MSYQIIPTVTTGELWTAQNNNTYIKENFQNLWQYDSEGDIVFADTATTVKKMPIGAKDSYLNSYDDGVNPVQWNLFNKTLCLNYHGTGQYTIRPRVISKLRFATALSNNSGMWSALTPDKITFPVTGVYTIDANVTYSAPYLDGYFYLAFGDYSPTAFNFAVSTLNHKDGTTLSISTTRVCLDTEEKAIYVYFSGFPNDATILNATMSINFLGEY